MESSRLTNAASASSSRTIEFSGASANLCISLSSLIALSERLRTQMEYSKAPARANMKLVLPQPGGPCSKYPLLQTFYTIINIIIRVTPRTKSISLISPVRYSSRPVPVVAVYKLPHVRYNAIRHSLVQHNTLQWTSLSWVTELDPIGASDYVHQGVTR